MKKVLCFAALMGFVNYAFAQNSNPWPTTGNVGIGTTTPGALLSISGASPSPASLRILTLENTNTGNGAGASIYMGYNAKNATNPYGIRLVQKGNPSGVRSGSFSIDRHGTLLGDSDAEWFSSLFIDYNGNLGVGTITPFKKLHVLGGTMAITTGDFLSTGTGSALLMGQNGTSGNVYSLLQAAIDGPNTGGILALNPNGGNVAIGTVDPKGYKFAVNGSAIATSMTVKLNSAWPDYVFKKEYKLRTLTAIEDYVSKNQHLPDMPSEKEVADKGLDLGEINKLLTKKVEELTLYLIKQNKALKAQNKRIEKLEARNRKASN